MLKYLRILTVAGCLFLLTGIVQAQGLPDGVTVSVLKEVAVTHLPGIVKVQFLEFRMKPGAKWMGHKVTASGFCTALEGTLTNEIVGEDKTVSFFAGENWVMEKGMTVNHFNYGTTDHVHRVWLLIEES